MDAQPETPPNRRSGPRAGGPSDADPKSGQGSPLPEPLAGLKFDANGLIPAIVQDWKTGQVLMMAWMNRDSLARTVRTAKTHFFSRSRNKLWLKGESSGHVQHVKSLATDCDKDVLLVKVEQVGAACHEGYQSCFFRELDPGGIGQADEGDEGSASGGADEAAPGGRAGGDWKVVGTKLFDPEKVYRK